MRGTMKLSVLLLSLVLFSFMPQSADAEIYKWKDKDGKIHFSDTPPKNQKAETREYVDTYGSEPGKKKECGGKLREGEKCGIKDGREIIISRNGSYSYADSRKTKAQMKTDEYLKKYEEKRKRESYSKAITSQANKEIADKLEKCRSLRKKIKKLKRSKARANKSYDMNRASRLDMRISQLEFDFKQTCR